MGAGSSRRRRSDSSVQIYSVRPPPPNSSSYGSYPPPPMLPPPPYQPSRYPLPPHHHPDYNGAIVPHQGSQYYPPSRYTDPRYQYVPPNGISSTLTPSPEDSSSTQQQSTTIRIRNTVNIQKDSIRLEEDEANPGFYLLVFSFSADFPGSFNIFYFAKVGDDCSVRPVSSYIFKPLQVPFDKGYGQTFKQDSGTGLYLDAIDGSDLERESPDEVCPLVIRAQTVTKDSQQMPTAEDIGGPLPKSVNAQLTQAVIERKDNGDCKVRVLRQVIWVDGVRYELKELYGIESAVEEGGYDEDDLGKDCVICMSEPRDTAVIPCRHVCMCSSCASAFKAQMNRCPICRQQVDSFLKIKVKT